MKNTVTTFQAMKDKGEKISMLTAYDYSTAKLEDAAGINGILVGDSLGNVVLGYDTTMKTETFLMLSIFLSRKQARQDLCILIGL